MLIGMLKARLCSVLDQGTPFLPLGRWQHRHAHLRKRTLLETPTTPTRPPEKEDPLETALHPGCVQSGHFRGRPGHVYSDLFPCRELLPRPLHGTHAGELPGTSQ